MKTVAYSFLHFFDHFFYISCRGFSHIDYETAVFIRNLCPNRPFIVLEVVFRMHPASGEEIQEKMDDLMQKRQSKQPLNYPSAGSTFKRPEGYFAGKLIMESGLRGYRIGGAQVSDKHCGFVVNVGKATAADVKEVIEEVQERVSDRFHVRLEPEIIFLGDF